MFKYGFFLNEMPQFQESIQTRFIIGSNAE